MTTSLALHINAGPHSGRRIKVAVGSSVTVGRTDRADICLADDPELSSIHFELCCNANGNRVRDLNSTNGTLINGHRISEAMLQDGDELHAGRSYFSVVDEANAHVDVDSPPPTDHLQTRPSSLVSLDGMMGRETGPDGFLARPANQMAAPIQFQQPKSFQLLRDDHGAAEFLDLLIEHALFDDAIRFLPYAMPKRYAVWWACRCVNDACGCDLVENEFGTVTITEQWVRLPTERNRRLTMEAAETIGMASPAAWPAAAAFWSSGSLAPPDAQKVSPSDALTGKAASIACMLAAVFKEPEKAPEKHQRFLDLGRQLAQQESPWEDDNGIPAALEAKRTLERKDDWHSSYGNHPSLCRTSTRDAFD